MPRRNDLHRILIIGSGPIIIGQACEFDYSGAQACKALRAEGYRVVLVNSNPATIMTDPGLADATYIEPITPEFVEKIIVREKENVPPGRVFALLPTMGGQTALNTALSLRKRGILEKYDIELIGASAEAIDKAEDRELFRQAMMKIGLDVPRGILLKGYLRHKKDSAGVFLYDDSNNPVMELSPEAFTHALQALDEVGLPAVIRPSFTLGGTGGGIAYNREEFFEIVERGLDASPTNEVLIEESVLGWKEFELEVVRDKADNAIVICSIENVDAMGVHTGDSITVAPALTLTDKEYQRMRSASSSVCATSERGLSRPILSIARRNFIRSSALSIASASAPIICTPYFASVPSLNRASAVLSAVCPPIVGRTASGRSLAMILATISGVIGST